MIRLRPATLAAIGILLPTCALAQSLGPYTTAQILPVDSRSAGLYLNASDSMTGLTSQLRMSFYPGIDFGFQGGFSRLEFVGGDKTLFQVGADLRFAALTAAEGAPLDFAMGGGFGIEVGDDYNLLAVGPMAFASRAFRAGASGTILPYGVMGMSFGMESFGTVDRTRINIPLNLGVEYRPNPVFSVAAELQLRFGNRSRDDLGFGGGVNVPF